MNLLDVPNIQSNYCRQGIAYRGPKIYNSISLEIRSIETFETFKCNVKKYYLKLQWVGCEDIYKSLILPWISPQSYIAFLFLLPIFFSIANFLCFLLLLPPKSGIQSSLYYLHHIVHFFIPLRSPESFISSFSLLFFIAFITDKL